MKTSSRSGIRGTRRSLGKDRDRCHGSEGYRTPTPLQGEPCRGLPTGDLKEEGANMLRLALAQEGAEPPLHGSSRQARAVLGQF